MRLCFFILCIISSFKISFSQVSIEGDRLETPLLYIKMDANTDSIGVLNFLSKSGLKPQSFLPFAYGHPNLQLSKIYKLQYVDYLEAIRAKEVLAESNLLEFVEFAPVNKTSYTPNDLDARQWYLGHIQAPNAWNAFKGNANIKIAIVDDAVDINHPDLKNSCYKNLGEIPSNGIDDDANGYIDDYDGWQAYYRTGDPSPPTITAASFSHGTHCAGIAAAETDNNLGIASIGFGIKIIPVSCSDKLNPGIIAAGYEGIIYAADAGAQIINLSWGSYTYSYTAKAIIDYAISKGCILVAAAGNDNIDIPYYPAAYSGVISVAATDENDRKATFSNYGTWIDISAPGVRIWSTLSGAVKYGYNSGTSMATPMVAGLCGILLSKNPFLTPPEIEKYLKKFSKNIEAQNTVYAGKLGSGRIDAFAALNNVKSIKANFNYSRISKPCFKDTLQFIDNSFGNKSSIIWFFQGGTPFTSTAQNPRVYYNTAGTYSVIQVISDGVSNDTFVQFVLVQDAIPKAILSGSQTVSPGQTGYIKIELGGNPNWSFDLFDGTNSISYSNISSTPYYISISPKFNISYSIQNFSDLNCKGVAQGIAQIIVGFLDTSKCSNNALIGPKFAFKIDAGKSEIPHQIIKLKDGNFLLAGITNSGVRTDYDAFVVKMDKNGQVIWSKTIGSNRIELGIPLNVFESKSGDIYLFGASYTTGFYEGFYYKLSNIGNVKWSKTFYNATSNDLLRCAAELKDGTIIFGGTSGINPFEAAQILRIDTSGNVIWSKSHDRNSEAEHYYDVVHFNSSIYWLGSTPYAQKGYGGLLTKTKFDGTAKFIKYIDYDIYDRASSFVEARDSGSLIIVSSSSNSGSSTHGGVDILLTRVDTNCNVVWSKIVGLGSDEMVSEVIRIGDFFYASGSTKSFDGGNSKLFLMKFDISGNIKWVRMYGSTNDILVNNNLYKTLVMGNDTAIWMAGQSASGLNDVFLYKVNLCGEASCASRFITFKETIVNAKVSDAGLVLNTVLPIRNIQTTSSNFPKPFVFNDICPQIKPVKCNIKTDFGYDKKCANDTVLFFDKSDFVNSSKISGYKWVLSDGTEFSNGPNAKFKFLNSGNYLVTKITFSDSPYFCSDTITKTIQVNDKLKAIIRSDKNKMCIGDTINLTTEVFCSTGNFDITWSPNQFIDDYKSRTPKITPPVSKWYYITLRDGSSNVYFDSVFIEINTTCCRYNASFQQPRQLCLGDSIGILNRSINNGTIQNRWNLFYNGALINSSTNLDYGFFKPVNSGQYRLDLITSGAVCKSDIATVNILVNPLPFIIPLRDTFVCSMDSVVLGSNPVEWLDYKWSPSKYLNFDSASMVVCKPLDSVKYSLTVKNSVTGCFIKHHVSVNIASKPKVKLVPDTLLCYGEIFPLNASAYRAKYKWNNGSHDSILFVSNPGSYNVLVSNACGVDSSFSNIQFKNCKCTVYLPTAFTPDGNNRNEFFISVPDCIVYDYSLRIYNRWGEKLFESTDPQKGWDGLYLEKMSQEGVYVYILTGKMFQNGILTRETFKGTFHLLR